VAITLLGTYLAHREPARSGEDIGLLKFEGFQRHKG
jgi:hypothetical protein